MIFPRSSNTRKRITAIFGILSVVFIIFLLTNASSVRSALGAGMTTVGKPFWALSEYTKNFPEMVRMYTKDQSELAKEIAELTRANHSLELQLLSLRATQEENTEIVKTLKTRNPREFVVASIVGVAAGTPYDTLRVRGVAKDPTLLGARAFIEDVPVGTVASHEGPSALVELFSAPARITEVFVGPNRIPGIATGRGSGNFILELSADLLIISGMIITLRDTPALVLAEVFSVEKEEHDALQRVYARSPINIQTASLLVIERSP